MIGMAGRLRLVVGLDGAGRCVLREQYAAQLHRVLQLIEGEVAAEGIVYLLNPTGGIAQGDDLEAEIRVEEGAHAIVTAPSATKIYRMDRGEASSRTALRVARGAILEYLPEPIIPHAGARYRESLELEVEEGGRAIAWELLAPGRSARGESLAYDRLSFRVEASEAGKVVLRERSEIVPTEGLAGPATLSRSTYYGILMVVGGPSGEVERLLREEIGGALAGVTRLPGTGVVLKALSSESAPMLDLFHRARERAMPQLSGRAATGLRRT